MDVEVGPVGLQQHADASGVGVEGDDGSERSGDGVEARQAGQDGFESPLDNAAGAACEASSMVVCFSVRQVRRVAGALQDEQYK